MPERLFLGRPAVSTGGRPADLADAINAPADADREAAAQRDVSAVFFTLLAGVQVLLAIGILPLLRRARPHAGPSGPTPVSGRVVAVVELLLVAAALTVPAALLADAVPWWQGEHPGWIFAGVTAFLVAAGTAAVRFTPGTRAPSARSARWPASPPSSSAWTSSPAPAFSSTAWSATPLCRVADTPG